MKKIANKTNSDEKTQGETFEAKKLGWMIDKSQISNNLK